MTAPPPPPSVRFAAACLLALTATAGMTANVASGPPTDDPVVGQIAGQALHASEVLDRCARELGALSADDQRAFEERARMIIADEVRVLVVNRILRIDAERSLTDAERAEMPAFAETVRARLVEAHDGDAAAADRQLRDTTGIGLEEAVAEKCSRAIIDRYMQINVVSRIVIDDAAIARAYRRQRDRFVTPEQRTVRVITTSDAAAADRIDAALAAGRRFAALAGEPDNTFKPAAGGLVGLPVEPASLRPALADAVAALGTGESSGRIDEGNRFTWVHVDAINPGHVVPIEEARPELERELRSQQYTALTSAHIASLMARYDVGGTDEMIDRAVDVVVQRRPVRGG